MQIQAKRQIYMKKFKKILAVVLSAGIAFSLAALSACTTTTA